MGIPRFYRWISERYPLINQVINDASLLPEFDNLYLDMNGIIHQCTHADDEIDLNWSRKNQILRIFHYIDLIVTQIVKPKKLLFLAVDGVAPRAKLNQQRSRRFQAGKEFLENKEKLNNNNTNNENNNAIFDPNCITPGTEFMFELNIHLEYFICKKIKEDPLWQNLRIIYSGQGVPGEGEHKIADFIRSEKMKDNYKSNIRHCMYGADADLMLLGLMTHEPHFILLREVINYKKNIKKKNMENGNNINFKKIKQPKWLMVHLSLFREYLKYEIQNKELIFYDFERIIDDIIFMTFFIGNDFIPHSPTLDIGENAIELLLTIYKKNLILWGGYLTLNGKLESVDRLQDFINKIGDYEENILSTRAEKLRKKGKYGKKNNQYMQDNVNTNSNNNKSKNNNNLVDNKFKTDNSQLQINSELNNEVNNELNNEVNNGQESNNNKDNNDDDINHEDGDQDDEEIFLGEFEEKDVVEIILNGSTSFQNIKFLYYKKKFNMSKEEPELLNHVRISYIEAILWCLHYYFQGPPSWSWFYPYHYSPMISDLVSDIKNSNQQSLKSIVNNITFSTNDGPLLPFEQLMATLPTSSKSLLPPSYQFLMTDETSPIIAFYPKNFKTDMDGKKNSWEGINLLPFIDTKLLKTTISVYCNINKLTEEEKKRNSFDHAYVYTHDHSNFDFIPSSFIDSSLPHIQSCQSKRIRFENDNMNKMYKSYLKEDVIIPIAGFPSLTTINIKSIDVKNININNFGFPSHNKTLLLNIKNDDEISINDHLKYLGKLIHANYPHLHEALVVGISTEDFIYRAKDMNVNDIINYNKFETTKEQKQEWISKALLDKEKYLSGQNIPGTGGICIKNGIHIYYHVIPIQEMICDLKTGEIKKNINKSVVGAKRTRNNNKNFFPLFDNGKEAIIPSDLIVQNPPKSVWDSRFMNKSGLPLEERFPVGSEVIILKGKYTGKKGIVLDTLSNMSGHSTDLIKLKIDTNDFINKSLYEYTTLNKLENNNNFYPTSFFLNKLNIDASTFGRLVTSFIVNPGRHDIGLNLKFKKFYKLQGYSEYKMKNNKNSACWDEKNALIFDNCTSDTENEIEEYEGSWMYSIKILNILFQYQTSFPIVFDVLRRLSLQGIHSNCIELKDVTNDIKSGKKIIKNIRQWLSTLETNNNTHFVPVSSQSYSKETIQKIENMTENIIKQYNVIQESSFIELQLDIESLYSYTQYKAAYTSNCNISYINNNTDLPNTPKLGDRVINLNGHSVPFGLLGTIVAFHPVSRCVEVLFDQPFMTGTTLDNSCSSNKGKLIPWKHLLCIGLDSRPVGLNNQPIAPNFQSHYHQEQKTYYQSDQYTRINNNNHYNDVRYTCLSFLPIPPVQHSIPVPPSPPLPPTNESIIAFLSQWTNKNNNNNKSNSTSNNQQKSLRVDASPFIPNSNKSVTKEIENRKNIHKLYNDNISYEKKEKKVEKKLYSYNNRYNHEENIKKDQYNKNNKIFNDNHILGNDHLLYDHLNHNKIQKLDQKIRNNDNDIRDILGKSTFEKNVSNNRQSFIHNSSNQRSKNTRYRPKKTTGQVRKLNIEKNVIVDTPTTPSLERLLSTKLGNDLIIDVNKQDHSYKEMDKKNNKIKTTYDRTKNYTKHGNQGYYVKKESSPSVTVSEKEHLRSLLHNAYRQHM